MNNQPPEIAQICLNGHLVNSDYYGDTDLNKKFCTECGAKTIIECKYCKTKIVDESGYNDPNAVPKYCSNCGKPYPWTEIRSKVAK